MTKVAQEKVKCIKCGEESEQLKVYSVNYSLGDKESNDRLVNHKQKCPYCNYEAIDISKDNNLNDTEKFLNDMGVENKKLTKEEFEKKESFIPKEELLKQIDERIDYLDLREKLIEKGKELLKVNQNNENTFKVKDLTEDKAIFMYQELRGGGSLIMDLSGNYLFFASSVNFEDALEKFRQGERSNN